MSDPNADLLAFSVDLDDVRARVGSLSYFNSVTNLQEATLALENMNALPPAAFVAIASETAERNKTIGGHSQRVTATVSILFCVPAESASDTAGDELEQARKAVIRILIGWQPKGADSEFDFDRYLLRANADGLIWGEVLMRTTYRITG